MIFPTVHLNGTSREALFDGFIEAHRAITEARKAIQAIYPNGRDYYTQGPYALRSAENEYDARLKVLGEMAYDLLLLAAHCQDS